MSPDNDNAEFKVPVKFNSTATSEAPTVNEYPSNESEIKEPPAPSPAPPAPAQPDSNQSSPTDMPPPPESNLNNPAPPTNHEPAPKKSHKKLWLALIIIIILVAVGVGIGLSLKPKHKSVVASKDIPLLRVGYFDGEVPHYPVAYIPANTDVAIASQMFEGLVGYVNQDTIKPLLATKWTNQDNSNWLFYLRPNVKFNTGRTMTATDVKYSLDYAIAHSADSNSQFDVASTIKSVQVVNSSEVKITTNVPDPILLNKLSLLFIVDSHAKLGDYVAGTGPYYPKAGVTPSANSVDLVASNTYWGGHVNTRELALHIYTNADSIEKDLAAGKLDLGGDLDQSQIAKLHNIKTFGVQDLGLNYLAVNTEKTTSPLYSVNARNALSEALNIPAIIKAGGIYGVQDSQIVPKQLPGYNPQISNATYNPTAAKQLTAGIKNISQPIVLAYPSGDTDQINEIAKELDSAGFTIKPTEVDDFDTFINNALGGQYDMFFLSDTSNTVDGLQLLSDLLVGNSNYNNPTVNNIVNEATSTFTPATRISQMQQVATIVNTDKPVIPLFTQTRQYAYSKPYVYSPDLPGLSNGLLFWKVHK